MPLISVKTKANRVAFDGPRGARIPNDRYVMVDRTPWVDRLIHVHGDVEVEPKAPRVAKPDPATAADKG